MKTILITGASGFLGHHLVKKFLDRGDSQIIAVLGRPEDKANSLPQNELVSVLKEIDAIPKEQITKMREEIIDIGVNLYKYNPYGKYVVHEETTKLFWHLKSIVDKYYFGQQDDDTQDLHK